ncbi:MAG: hypothetical protein HFE78_03040 [Clostridiales bacterium]|nr:hypothetical protein [Clostridiales bacterium]
MTEKLPFEIQEIINALAEKGHAAYLVGGCVRDRLLGFVPTDYDLCTSATPDEMKLCFAGMKVVETGIKHGTLTVVNRRTACEVTTFRTEKGYTDKRRPDQVFFTTRIEEDLSRRDFTMNAMAYAPGRADGGLIDLFGGQQDLAAGVIRTVGDPGERFEEDPLRILRALRFAAKLDFIIEEKTYAAMHAHKALLAHIAAERVTAELIGLVMGKAAQRVTGQMGSILSCILAKPAVVHDSLAKDPCVRLAAFYRQSKDDIAGLRLSKSMHRTITALFSYEAPLPKNQTEALFLLHEMGLEQAVQLCQFREDAGALAAVAAAKESGVPYAVRHLAVNGHDLLQAGVPELAVGQVLEKVLALVIEGKLENQKESLLGYILQEPLSGCS